MMKFLKILIPLFLLFLYGCKDSVVNNDTGTINYKEILSVNISEFTIKLYITGYDSLTTGYNEVYFKVAKDSIEQRQGNLKFFPKMWMTPHLWHSTPASSVFLYDNSSGYFKGYVIFNMATTPPGLIWRSIITYHDENGIDHISDSVDTYTSYHQEKQWKVFYDSTEQTEYYLTLVKPFSPVKQLNDFWVILHKTDGLDQSFDLLSEPQMFISAYSVDSLNQSSGNISPVVGADGIYKGKVNFPDNGNWILIDTISYHNHIITNNPPPMPDFNFVVK